MGTRLELQAHLEAITPRVYFQPPENLQMEYPCIIYSRDSAKVDHADDVKYKNHFRYQVMVVGHKSISEISDAVYQMRYCEFERSYPADGLNHDVYNLFF